MTAIDNVLDVIPRVQYTAAVSQTDFDYPFAIFTDADLVVDVDGVTQALSTDYSVSGAGDDTGGTVTFLSALTGGETVTIYRDIAIERTSDFPRNGPISSETMNDEFDRLTLVQQQIEAAVKRCLRIPTTAFVLDDDMELLPADWAGMYLTFDSNGKPTPAALIAGSITQGIIAGLLNPITDIETAHNIDIPSPQYATGNVFRYLTSVQIDDVLDGSLSQDLTSVLQDVIDLGIALYWPSGKYLTTESLTLLNRKGVFWKGDYALSIIVNKASAGKPTVVFTDTQQALIETMVIEGRAGFPNDAILLTTAGGQTTGILKLRHVILQPNGNGVEIRKCNTMRFDDVHYWPSGGISSGVTVDAGTKKHAFFNDSAVSGNYCNEVSFTGCNMVGVDTTISGHACIKLAGGNGVQNVTVFDCEMEGIGLTSLDITGAYGFVAKECFVENSDIILTSCRHSEIHASYNPDDVTFASCISTYLIAHVQGPVTTSFTIDAGCTDCGAIRAEFQNAPSDSGTNSVFEHWTIAGVRQADRIGGAGIRERGRTVANGIGTTPAFSAGDYTGTTGTWTVAAGDVTDISWTPLAGKRIRVDFDLRTTTTTGGVTALNIKIPGGFTAAVKDKWGVCHYSVDNGTTTLVGMVRVIGGGTTIQITSGITAAAFSNVTDLLMVRGSIDFETA